MPSMARIRRVESKREQEKVIDDFLTRGYKIQSQGEFSAKVKDRDFGSAPVHVFIFLFTLIASAVLFDAAGLPAAGVWVVTILANAAYATYSWFTAEEIVIKVTQDD